MRKTRNIFALSILLTVLCTGCSAETPLSKNTKSEEQFFAMDTYMTLTAYGTKAEDGLAKAKQAILDVEQEFSATDDESAVYHLNESAGEETAVSEELFAVTKKALEIGEQSGGAFDITMYPVLKLWGFTTGEYQVPKEEELSAQLAKTGYGKIKLNEEKRTITLPDGMEVDYGGIAKGYSGDRAIEELKSSGVESAILSLGGNIATLGSKPDGSAWTVAITDPEDTQNYFAALQVRDKAVVTSGGYERYFTDDDGNRWCHILNPDTGYPADSGLLSVTVIGSSGEVCDALSTTLFVLGMEKATDYWKTYGGFEMVLMTDEHEIYATCGLRDSLALTGDYKGKEIHYIE